MDGVKRGLLVGWRLLQALVSMPSLSDICLRVRVADIPTNKIHAHACAVSRKAGREFTAKDHASSTHSGRHKAYVSLPFRSIWPCCNISMHKPHTAAWWVQANRNVTISPLSVPLPSPFARPQSPTADCEGCVCLPGSTHSIIECTYAWVPYISGRLGRDA